MHSHFTEIMPKLALHEFPGLSVNQSAGRAQNFADNRRHNGVVPGLKFRIPSVALQLFLSAFALATRDRKSTRLNSSHPSISYAVFCLKKKNQHRLHRLGDLQSIRA